MREHLGLGPLSPLCPWKLADHLGLHVLDIKQLPIPANDIDHLTGAGSKAWSGFSIRHAGLIGVVLNTSHSLRRLRSTLMHEIAHIHLRHVGSRVDVNDSGILLISDFSREQEEEADWLSGALLLPRDALLEARKTNNTIDQICEEFGVSSDLCNWRLRMTAVDTQLKRRRFKSQ